MVRRRFLKDRKIENTDVFPTIPFDRTLFGYEAREAALRRIRDETFQGIPIVVADFFRGVRSPVSAGPQDSERRLAQLESLPLAFF